MTAAALVPVSLRLPPALAKRLDRLAKKTGRSKTFYMTEAITEYMEDLEDYYLAERVSEEVRTGKQKTYSHEEMMKRYGVVP